MSKHDNLEINFSLKGAAAIQIGVYFLLFAYILNTLIEGFLIDDNPVGMMSPQILEVTGLFIYFLAFLLIALALYFKGKRKAKRFNYKLWNRKTKTSFGIAFSSFLSTSFLVITALYLGYVDAIAPIFLLCYGAILLAVKQKTRKQLLIVAGISILLAVLCLLIPSYWYSAILILGIAHITYGIVVRN